MFTQYQAIVRFRRTIEFTAHNKAWEAARPQIVAGIQAERAVRSWPSMACRRHGSIQTPKPSGSSRCHCPQQPKLRLLLCDSDTHAFVLGNQGSPRFRRAFRVDVIQVAFYSNHLPKSSPSFAAPSFLASRSLRTVSLRSRRVFALTPHYAGAASFDGLSSR